MFDLTISTGVKIPTESTRQAAPNYMDSFISPRSPWQLSVVYYAQMGPNNHVGNRSVALE